MTTLPPLHYPDHANLLVRRDAAGKEGSITALEQWEDRRQHILHAMQEVMGTLPQPEEPASPAWEVLAEEKLPGFTRRRIQFQADAGEPVPAWLLLPHRGTSPYPAMLCLHQTTSIGKDEPAGLGGNPHFHYAAHLAERGYVTLAPDYCLHVYQPEFKSYRCDPYVEGYISGTMKGIRNHRRAVDLLGALPVVDTGRIGCIGHSLGGHNTLFLGAFEPRLRVLVTSCGFTTFRRNSGGDIAAWSHRGYMPRIRDQFACRGERMPFDFHEVLALQAPRPVFINAPVEDDFEVEGVREAVTAARDIYELYRQPDNLQVVHPTGGHDFPDNVREGAYRWLDQYLNRESYE